MKAKQIRNQKPAVLKQSLKEQQEKLVNLRFALSLKKVKNVRAVRETRRNIARIKTILIEYETNPHKQKTI